MRHVSCHLTNRLKGKKILAIGRGTEETVGYDCFAVSSLETQEGMIELIKTIDLQESYMLYPRSSKARPLLAEYLKETGIQHQICDLYETVYLKPEPIPALEDFEEIVFTSPSTVKAFLALYGSIPKNKKITCIGPITEQAIINFSVPSGVENPNYKDFSPQRAQRCQLVD